MSTYKDQLQKYYNSKYFMSNPDNWQELANQAVARDLAKYQENKPNKEITLDEIVVTPKGTITKVPAVETDFTPHENKILATPNKKTIHYSDYEGRKNMLEAQSAANKVALGLGVGAAPVALGALLDAGVGAVAAQLAKHTAPLARSAFKHVAPKILQGFKYLNYLDPFTKEFASMGIGKQAAVGALESIGLADAIQNTGEFVKNPSWNKVPDAVMNTLYALPYANAIKSGIRTSNTVNKIGKYVTEGSKHIDNFVKNAYIANKLNKQIKNTKLRDPIPKLDLQDGYLFHNGHVDVFPAGYNGKKFTYILKEARPGALKIEDEKYKSVRPPHNGNPDLLWWDTKGHNYGQKVYVTKQGDDAIHVRSHIKDLPISQVIERYNPNYYVTGLKPINSVIEYTFDPISGSFIPHMPGKVLNNKMSYEEILALPVLLQSKTIPTKISLAFFERGPAKISEAERLGIPKGERKKNIHTGKGTELPDPAYSEINYPGEYDPITNPNGTRIPYHEWNNQAIKRVGRNRSHLMLHRANDHDEVIGNLKKYADLYDGEIYKFVKNNGDSYYIPDIIGDYRSYLNHLGYDGAKLTDDEIAKILSALYFQLSSIMSGKGKGKILWHSSPEWFDRFLYENNLTKNTGNVGFAGAGNNFSTNRTLYGGKDVNNTLPFMINNINSIPSSTTGRQRGFVSDYGYSDYIELALLDTPHDYKLIWNTSGLNPQGTLKSDLLGGEFTFRRNDGIKSLFPHPSLISIGDDGIVKIDRDLSNILFNYRKGGKINYINLF